MLTHAQPDAHRRAASVPTRHLAQALTLAAGVLLTLVLPQVARAGGWVTITTVDQPSEVRAGEPARITMNVMQHGQTAIDWITLSILATNPATGETVRADAAPGKPLGIYIADVTFPSSGAWTWEATTNDLAVLDSVFQPIAVHSTDAAFIGITQSDLDTTFAPLATNLTDVQARVKTLEGDLTALSAERESLRADLAALRSDANATEQTTRWLIVGLVIVSALLLATIATGVILLQRKRSAAEPPASIATINARWRAT